MSDINNLINEYEKRKVALYGLGTETERFIAEHKSGMAIEGLLDGFKEDGEIYGYPIIPLNETVARDVRLIIVVARPGSCKAIAKRIGSFCMENAIALFDVRGKDLLSTANVQFDFSGVKGDSRQTLTKKISEADVISFDLFDTLIMRKVFSYTDIFELIDLELRKRGIIIPDFSRLRLHAEKELSKNRAPKLEDIYRFVLKKSGGNFVSAKELADMEWQLDLRTIIARNDMRDLLKETISSGKIVLITTDSYYSREQIQEILDRFHIEDAEDLFVSCEYGTSKTQELFEILKNRYGNKRILHIGDDETADIEKAAEYGLEACRIFSGTDLYDSLGGLGIEDEVKTISDRIKAGMMISTIFNSPFWFEEEAQRLSVRDASRIGFLFCAPMLTDFVLWMKREASEQGFEQILFCARDGYLPGKLFREVSPDTKSIYFLSSRTAAIRAGMENDTDIDYVDSMKYFGSPEDALKTRFGISVENISRIERGKEILLKAGIQRGNYKKYIEKLGMQDGNIGMFDFVAKGTTQMYLQKLFPQHIKGFYFLQLEPEFMADKELDIEPFYSDEEKNSSAIFDNYYILEAMLTSPYSQMEEFDESGDPVFAEETRSESDIKVFEQAQEGITEYFEEYIRLVPKEVRIENKKLDEKMLSLVNRIQILDESFLALQVEDPFFGRMTNITDVIG